MMLSDGDLCVFKKDIGQMFPNPWNTDNEESNYKTMVKLPSKGEICVYLGCLTAQSSNANGTIWFQNKILYKGLIYYLVFRDENDVSYYIEKM